MQLSISFLWLSKTSKDETAPSLTEGWEDWTLHCSGNFNGARHFPGFGVGWCWGHEPWKSKLVWAWVTLDMVMSCSKLDQSLGLPKGCVLIFVRQDPQWASSMMDGRMRSGQGFLEGDLLKSTKESATRSHWPPQSQPKHPLHLLLPGLLQGPSTSSTTHVQISP